MVQVWPVRLVSRGWVRCCDEIGFVLTEIVKSKNQIAKLRNRFAAKQDGQLRAESQ
jgi:hypothetical protein